MFIVSLETGRKTIKLGAVPSLNLPVKSCETTVLKERRHIVRTVTTVVEPYIIPKYEVIIDDSLEFTVVVFNWILPENHLIYKNNCRTMRNVTVSQLVHEIQSYNFCTGITDIQSSELLQHSIPKNLDLENCENQPIPNDTFRRPKDCMILKTDEKPLCLSCDEFKKKINKTNQLKKKALTDPRTVKHH